MNDDIRFILERAIRAPSGDNSQPWRFVVRGNTIELWDNIFDTPFNNLWNQSHRTSFIAMGATLENIILAATICSMRSQVVYFPDPAQPLFVAKVTLQKDTSIQADALASAIDTRCSDRKPYTPLLLSQTERKALMDAAEGDQQIELKLLDDRRSIYALAAAISSHEKLLFSNKMLHHFLFSHINWTKRADTIKHEGFYYPTIESPPFMWQTMRLIRHWWIMRICNLFGAYIFVATRQKGVYRRSGAFGAVVSSGDTPFDWVEVGRKLERVWLAATKLGLNMQPTTGIIFLSFALDKKAGMQALSDVERQYVRSEKTKIDQIFDVDGKNLAFMFRVGHGAPPSARTSRLPLEKVVQVIEA